MYSGLRDTFRRSEFDVALAGIDLSVAEGEIFGLLGPNGAGKTTLIKILCGLVIADEGDARIAGFDVSEGAAARRAIGVVYGDERSFHWRLSVRDNLRFFARLYHMPQQTADARIDELIALVGLEHAADRRMLGFSSGMKQRASIARGLLHDPAVVLMDEPTRTLDPIGTFELHSLIRDRIAAQGRTVLVATNLMTEVETLCDRVLLINRGRPVLHGTVGEFRAAFRPETVYRFLVEGPVGAALDALPAIAGVHQARVEARRADAAELVVTFDRRVSALPAIIRLLVDANLEIVSCLKEEVLARPSVPRRGDRTTGGCMRAVTSAYFRRDWLVWSSYRFAALWQVIVVTSVVVGVAFAGNSIVAKAKDFNGSQNFASFVLAGLAFTDALFSGLTGPSRAVRDGQTSGTLEPILLTPVRTWQFIIGSSVFQIVLAFFRAALLLFAAVVFLGYWHHADIPAAILVFVPAFVTFLGLGLLASAFTMVVKQGDPVVGGYIALSGLLGGTLIPITLLPSWVRGISELLPLTHALNGLRLALDGGSLAAVGGSIGVLAVMAAIALTRRCHRRELGDRTRSEGGFPCRVLISRSSR